ncbi:uncharacterized protein LOC132563729 [Ylistrum balloti]|uniref:uncharacterized protein LOC132563729 n=1 Tax=Ylistrum balloti TaxID=509963 RepID=UPI002905D055|nr:uncharacterized protein LOC132563729 [Ylistrum balloti]
MTNALQMVVVMGSLYDTYVTSNDSVTVLCFGESIHKARGMLQLTPLPLSVQMVMSPPASTKSPYHMMLLRQSRSQDYLIMIGLNDCEQVPSDWFTYVRNFDPNIEYHLLRLKWSNVSTEVDRYKHVNFSKAEFDYKKLKMVTHITPAISTSSPNITNYPASSVVSGTMTTGTDILAPTSVGHFSKTSYAPGSSTLYRPYTYVVGMCTYSCDAAVVPVNTSDPIQKQMLERQVKELKKLLTVNKTGLSSTRRRKESAIDLRISAKAFGFVGTVMLCTCIMIIISADIPRLSRAILHFKAQIVVCWLFLLHICTASQDRLAFTRENHERSGSGSQCLACPILYNSQSTHNHHNHHNHANNDWYMCIHIEYSPYHCDYLEPECVPFLGETYIIFGQTYMRVRYKHTKKMWVLADSVRCENNCCNGECRILGINSFSSPTVQLPTTTPVVTTTPPEKLQVRLVNGPSALEGRLEVYHDGRWGTVCDDNWDDDDARVVCGMLGYSSLHATHTSKARYGSGQGPIWLDETQCSGQETNLGQCTSEPYGHGDCDHTEDAGVICQALPTTTSTTTAASTVVPRASLKVRLVNGPNAREGRVEVKYNGVWGTVCDDNWDDDDAKVVCGMLGYSSHYATHTSKARYGSGQGPIWLDETQCSGQETNLGQCNSVPYGHGDCDHTEDAGVICQDITSSTSVAATTTLTSTPSTTKTSTTSSTTMTSTMKSTTKSGHHWLALGSGTVCVRRALADKQVPAGIMPSYVDT